MFQVNARGNEHRLDDGVTVSLRGREVENFISRNLGDLVDVIHYRLSVDREVYETKQPSLTGSEVKAIADLSAAVHLFQVVQGQQVPVADDQIVSLNHLGTEQFVTIEGPAIVQVSVTYTTTAQRRQFEARLSETLQSVVDRAYSQVGETPRPDDGLLTGTNPRTDLRPHLHSSLQQLLSEGIVLGRAPHLKLQIDIDAPTGGA
jgi:Multiubiquitin